jgi:hypothetical protein
MLHSDARGRDRQGQAVSGKVRKGRPQATYAAAVSDKFIGEFHDRNLYAFVYDLAIRNRSSPAPEKPLLTSCGRGRVLQPREIN